MTIKRLSGVQMISINWTLRLAHDSVASHLDLHKALKRRIDDGPRGHASNRTMRGLGCLVSPLSHDSCTLHNLYSLFIHLSALPLTVVFMLPQRIAVTAH